MAQLVPHVARFAADDSAAVLTVTLPVWAPDQYDGLDLTDWGRWGEPGWPTEDESDDWPLDGVAVVAVVGVGSWFCALWRVQGQSVNPWRTGSFDALTPLEERSFPVGSGPTPRSLADLPGVSCEWSSG